MSSQEHGPKENEIDNLKPSQEATHHLADIQLKHGDTTVLFRPVGKKEYELIEESGFKKFPPRLFHQPFFYPVTNKEYAEQIARDWNTKDPVSDFIGYVTQFYVKTGFLSQYEQKTVGKKSLHEEYWIPSEDLERFNENIVGGIEIVNKFQREVE